MVRAWHYSHTVAQLVEQLIKFVSSGVDGNSVQMPAGRKRKALTMGWLESILSRVDKESIDSDLG